jgi:biotin carboxylase
VSDWQPYPVKSDPVLVVGTTPDYVQRLFLRRPSSTLFLLDRGFKDDPRLKGIDNQLMIFAPLSDERASVALTAAYLEKKGLAPAGVACFDCESLLLANILASRLGGRFPDRQAIIHARNKFAARDIWRRAGLPTPLAVTACNLSETLSFFQDLKGPVVLKPLSGSGSELLFRCEAASQVRDTVQILQRELLARKGRPLFAPIPQTKTAGSADPCGCWIVEEAIDGDEFSCDFLLHDEAVHILRETGKLRDPEQSFGSVMAYTLPPEYPKRFRRRRLPEVLGHAARALGFTWGHFMADYMVREGWPVLIELTPRPGGDSIPDLVEIATGRNMLDLHLDIAAGHYEPTPGPVREPAGHFASINIYGPREGVITRLDVSRLEPLPWIKGVFLRKNVGETILLPPRDYDNRLIGYVIVSVEPGRPLTGLCSQSRRMIHLEVS